MKLISQYILGWVVSCLLVYAGISFFWSSETADNYIIYVVIVFAIAFISGYRDEKKQKKNQQSDNLVKKEVISKKFKLNDKGYFSLWKGNIKVAFRSPYASKIEDYTVTELMVSKEGWDIISCLDSQNNELLIDVEEVETKFTYKSKRYDFFDEVLQELIGFEKFYKDIDEKRTDYISCLEESEEELETEREEQPMYIELYSFTPVLLNFSIFGDYFDSTQPPDSMKFELLCNGVIGYRDSGNPYALSGINTANNEPVNIRITAIRSLIKYNNERYDRDDFVELAKDFK